MVIIIRRERGFAFRRYTLCVQKRSLLYSLMLLYAIKIEVSLFEAVINRYNFQNRNKRQQFGYLENSIKYNSFPFLLPSSRKKIFPKVEAYIILAFSIFLFFPTPSTET